MAWTALDWTDKKLEEIERHLRKLYEQAEKDIGKAWKAYMEEKDAEVERLGKAYGEAKKSGDQDAIRSAGIAVSKAKQERTIYNRRYQRLTKNLAQEISRVNETAARYINRQLPEIYTMNYNEVAEGMNINPAVALRGYSFDLVDASTVRRLAAEQENLLPYKEINGRRDVRWNIQKINSAVTQGIIQGDSIPKIANRLEDVLGMNETSAIRNARTTVTSAQNKGRMDMMHDAYNKGVISKKGWSSAHDKRVRKSHQLMDNGEFIDMDAEFGNGLEYPGDPDGDPEEVYNCRCSLIYDVVGFASPITGEINYLEGKEPEDEPDETEQESERSAERNVPMFERDVDFAPANSIAEAEEYASRFIGYGGSVSYKGIDLKYANECNKVLTEINESFNIEKMRSIQPMNMRTNLFRNSTSEAAYRWGNGDLFINPKYYKNTKTFSAHKDEIDSLMKTISESGQKLLDSGRYSGTQKNYIEALLQSGRQCVCQSHDFVEGTFVHESGHMLHDKLLTQPLRDGFGAEKFFLNDKLSESRSEYGRNISGYAITDNREYIAESFTAWWYGEGDKCDPIIVKVFEGLVKK